MTPVKHTYFLEECTMQRFRDFLKRKDIEISLRRYGIDALGAMAQGLFLSLIHI